MEYQRKPLLVPLALIFIFTYFSIGMCGENGWYTQGNFKPEKRIEVHLENQLDIDRVNIPVIIKRDQMPVQDLHELWITVVDPAHEPRIEPSKEQLAKQGGHQIRGETNGYAIFHQLDDLDKDGIWDELFFMTAVKAKETKVLFLYLGYNQRGWNKHETHAGIGSYCRHLVPFWESAHVGWKLWYPTDCDVYGKRGALLMSQRLYMENLDGYGVSNISSELGSDIMSVSNSFGGGGICLFENPDKPTVVSRPRFTPARENQNITENFNAGQINDTRYSFDVVVNGPMRSIIKAKTMNWNTNNGSYELEQYYTAYANQNYSTCKVIFTRFIPKINGVLMGCGVRKRPDERLYFQNGGVVVTAGPEEIRNPDVLESEQSKFKVDYAGTGLIVKDVYQPGYVFVPEYQGNHVFKIPDKEDKEFEYMILAAWSDGLILKSQDEFKDYVLEKANEYNNPIKIMVNEVESYNR